MSGPTIIRPGAFHSPARKTRLLLASLPIFAALLSEDGHVLECNFGPLGGPLDERTDWIGQPFETGQWWNYSDDSRTEIAAMLSTAQSAQPVSRERLYRKPDGTMGVMVLTLTPLFAPLGRPDAILVTAVDVTERRREVDTANHIARDMAHRLRNSFTMMRALASEATDDPQLPRRLGLIRSSQSLSYRYLFFDVPTQEIVEAVLDHPKQLTQATYGPDPIPAEYVETLMLALSELAQAGHSAEFTAERIDNTKLCLLWRETKPRADKAVPSGLPHALLTIVPEQKTGGTVQVENTSEEFSWRFTFPLQHSGAAD